MEAATIFLFFFMGWMRSMEGLWPAKPRAQPKLGAGLMEQVN